MQFKIRPMRHTDTEATCIVVADMNGNERIILGDMLKIDSSEYENAIRNFNGIPYCISNFAAFVQECDAVRFMNEYLIPQAVAAKCRGVRF